MQRQSGFAELIIVLALIALLGMVCYAFYRGGLRDGRCEALGGIWITVEAEGKSKCVKPVELTPIEKPAAAAAGGEPS